MNNNQNQSSGQSQIKQLFSMTWPMLFGVLSLMSYQLADSVYISRLGIEPLAVIGFTIPVYQFIIGIQVGVGIATTALISQRLGAGNERDARLLGGNLLLMGTGMVLLVCIALWLMRTSLLDLMGGEPALLPLFTELWAYWLPSAFLGAVLYFGYSISRAHGDTLLPGLLMVVTSLLNIGLDPLFIFTLDLGLRGAPIATIVSFSVGLAIVYPKILLRHWLGISTRVKQLFTHAKTSMTIALPAMAGQLMPSLAAIIATAVVAKYGTEAVAAWGLGVRVEFFALVLVLALTMSMPPMIGRYFGSKNFDEIKSLVALGVKTIVVTQLLLALLVLLFARPLSVFMAESGEVATQLRLILILLPASYASLGVCMLMVSLSNAISQSLRALCLSIVRLFACYLPFLYAGSFFWGFEGLVAGAACGNVIAGLVAWRVFQQGLKKASVEKTDALAEPLAS